MLNEGRDTGGYRKLRYLTNDIVPNYRPFGELTASFVRTRRTQMIGIPANSAVTFVLLPMYYSQYNSHR